MKKYLKGLMLLLVCAGITSLTSCKKESTETTTDTDTEMMADGEDTVTTTDVVLDETGAQDTIAVSTDTVMVKKP